MTEETETWHPQDEEILCDIADELDDRPPTPTDWAEHPDTPVAWETLMDWVEFEYGGWDEWLVALDVLSPEQYEGRESIIDLLYAIYETEEQIAQQALVNGGESGTRNPRLHEVVEFSNIPASEFMAVFDSWPAALDAAFAHQSPECRNLPEEELSKEIRRLTLKFGRPPKQEEIIEEAAYSLTPFRNKWGTIEEIHEAAGVAVATEDEDPRREMLDEVRQLADELGRPPKATDMKEYGEYSHSAYYAHWDSWDDVREAAGLKPSTRCPTEEELLADYRRVKDDLGHEPTVDEINAHSTYSYDQYYNTFGGLRQVKNKLDECDPVP